MIHEQEFIELKKKEREGIVARDLLDSLKIRGKKLRKAKRKEPEIQKMLQEKLKQDTIYQSYMNGHVWKMRNLEGSMMSMYKK